MTLDQTQSQTNNLMPTYARHALNFVSGDGVWITDDKGHNYLDCVAGVAVNSLGHSHPLLHETLIHQGSKLLHVSNLYYTPPQLTLAKRLTELSGMEAVFFSNSGTEAVEAALKTARRYGKRLGAYKTKIIHVSGSFHGRTMGALTVTSNVKYQAPFLPLVGDTEECPFNDEAMLARMITDDVCAVIMEPIQGESGVKPLNPAFVQLAKDLCEKHRALLIFDEVQCGIGRTGSMFFHQQLNIKPDILCLAKGLGSGFPIGATLVNKKANALEPGDHGSTFGGNPLACAMANTVLDVIDDQVFLDHVQSMGNLIKTYFESNPHPHVEAITGEGLLLGLQLNVEAAPIIKAALKEKLLLIGAGPTTIRIIPPLIITKEEVDELIKRLVNVL
jgi:acetylornithine/N-succinyldiaminopimelate aminotransferase